MRRTSLLALVASVLAAPALGVVAADAGPAPAAQERTVRFSTFNASMNRSRAGQLVADLSTPGNTQAQNVAETIQRVDPDVLLVNEFDYDPRAVDLFRDNYLEVPHNGAPAVEYPYAYIAPSNTGVPSGYDLDNNGTVGGGNDAFGFGEFEGQYGMVVYSKFPIETDRVRTFQHFLWKDMPGNRMPTDFYSAEEQQVLRLSSKSHWDVPIRVHGRRVHFLVSHPTPPVFDGTEDRNGRRNADEIRFWADYVSPGQDGYIYDDAGRTGGLRGGAFVIAGDQNSDPLDGDSIPGAAQQLLDNPRVNTAMTPSSAGATEAVALQRGSNLSHRSDPAYDTGDFDDRAGIGPGNLRVDYVLPSRNLRIIGSGVFWPTSSDPLYRLTGNFPFVPTSDHRQVWVDVRL
jgi:hypothetical protein